MRLLPIADDLLHGCAGRSCMQPPVEAPAFVLLVGDDSVAEAPPELERSAAAGDRLHRVDRAAGSVGIRQLRGCPADSVLAMAGRAYSPGVKKKAR